MFTLCFSAPACLLSLLLAFLRWYCILTSLHGFLTYLLPWRIFHFIRLLSIGFDFLLYISYAFYWTSLLNDRFLLVAVAAQQSCPHLASFPNSRADRGSNRSNSIEACWFPSGCRLEKGFREVKNKTNARTIKQNRSFLMFSCKTYILCVFLLKTTTRIYIKSGTFASIFMNNAMFFFCFLAKNDKDLDQQCYFCIDFDETT